MLAMLWTQRIVNGKKTYDQVPRLLKEQVKELLIESGCEDLITDSTPVSKQFKEVIDHGFCNRKSLG